MEHEQSTLLSQHSSERTTHTSTCQLELSRQPFSPGSTETSDAPSAGRRSGPRTLEAGSESAQTAPRRWHDLHACVARLLECNCGIQVSTEKRTHRRYPFRRPLTITPVDNSTGRPNRARNFAAFGFDISSAGISFLARQLVPARRAIVACDGPENRVVNLLFEPRWVRFTRGGWYQTGGRLVEVLPDDTALGPILRLLEAPPDDL